MGDQQKGSGQRGGDGQRHRQAGALAPGEREPGDDDRRREELQHGRRGGVGAFDGHQEG